MLARPARAGRSARGRSFDGAHPSVDDCDERERGERRLEQEDASPAEQLGQEPTERRAHRDADGARERPHPDRVLVAPRDPGQDGNRPDEGQRRTEPLDRAPDDEHLERGREPARERSGREHAQSNAREHMPAHALLEREHPDRADNDGKVVRSDRPRHGDDRYVEGAVQRRQREHDDRRICNRQRDRQRDDRDQQPITATRKDHRRKRRPSRRRRRISRRSPSGSTPPEAGSHPRGSRARRGRCRG